MTAGFAFAPPPVASLAIMGRTDRFPVRRIYCVGRNYLDHIREMKESDERDPPFFFQKPRDSLVEDGATVPYPPDTSDFQFEIELNVAIGRAARKISAAQARDVIFGYGIAIDLTRRDRQRECRERALPWEAGKSFDRSAPCGPIHPVGSVGHREAGEITLHVNGELRQRGDLAQMIWNVPEIIANLSASYDLEPGDLIMTGTPAGVGPVKPGDHLTGAIAGLGQFSIAIGSQES